MRKEVSSRCFSYNRKDYSLPNMTGKILDMVTSVVKMNLLTIIEVLVTTLLSTLVEVGPQ